jgi:hypothetical protein
VNDSKVAIISIVSYVGFGFLIAVVRAWRIGVHRADFQHRGERDRACSHWACDVMVGEFLAILPVGWPIFFVFTWTLRLFVWLMKGPYERMRPPLHEHPTAKKVCEDCLQTKVHHPKESCSTCSLCQRIHVRHDPTSH